MFHKTNKQKGFTLIELMVVISIISLLSSVVLAALKDARDRAEGAKIVSEIRSLQTALELYRSQFGNYPIVGDSYSGGVDEDENVICAKFCGGFNDFIKTYLVDNRFISTVPQSKGYPNNCIDGDCRYGNMFFYTGSSAWVSLSYEPGMYEVYYMCGGQKVSGYILGYVTTQKLNLPEFTRYSDINGEGVAIESGLLTLDPSWGVNQYCVSI